MRADITPYATTTSREALFGFEEGGRVSLVLLMILVDFDLSANQ
jgi:hypothetical protein